MLTLTTSVITATPPPNVHPYSCSMGLKTHLIPGSLIFQTNLSDSFLLMLVMMFGWVCHPCLASHLFQPNFYYCLLLFDKGNSRGNTYSRNNVHYTTKGKGFLTECATFNNSSDKEFWEFSWDGAFTVIS